MSSPTNVENLLTDSQRGLLRFATAGSVDDGKSTLIGRLLHDSKSLFQDTLEALAISSQRRGQELDLSLVTDGLKAEREQGITIDVAYRYFATPKRNFIIADTPGHAQYTRNMVTGASNADVAIILLDAKNGLTEQSRRHTMITSMLGIKHVVVAVNKMDLVDWSQDRFNEISAELGQLARSVGISDSLAIPLSALLGDNVVDRGANCDWYNGPTLLSHLEEIDISHDVVAKDEPMRFPVQYVIREAGQGRPIRHYAGTVERGQISAGDDVIILPGEISSKVAQISTIDGPRDCASQSDAVTITLETDVDVARGDVIVHSKSAPEAKTTHEMSLCWFETAPLRAGRAVLIKHLTTTVRANVTSLISKYDLSDLTESPNPSELVFNDLGVISLQSASPLCNDTYAQNKTTGSAILIDPVTNSTIGAGMFR